MAEKIGLYDEKLGSIDHTKNPTAYADYLEQNIKKVATLDFTSERKTMSTVVTGFNGNANTLLLKGAPERVIDKCVSYKLANGSVQNITKEQKEKLLEKV
jgi:Ca2+-transporting ATPase